MKYSLITVFPEMVTSALQWGVIGRALEKKLFEFKAINPRDFTSDNHKTIDDRPFGGGDGMVMMLEPLTKALESIPDSEKATKIYLSPSGRVLDEALVKELSTQSDFILLSGRYGGVDQRFLNHHKFMSVSVGDYVVSGGELPALILMDAILRKQPGVLGNNESSLADSFAQHPHLEAPLFTRPRESEAGTVPEVLLSGDHKKIEEFRYFVGLGLTLQNRPDLVAVEESEMKKLRIYLQKLEAKDLKTLGFQDDFLQRLRHG